MAKIDVGKDEITRYIKDYIRSAYWNCFNQTLPEEQEQQIKFYQRNVKKSENVKMLMKIFSKNHCGTDKNINPTIEK